MYHAKIALAAALTFASTGCAAMQGAAQAQHYRGDRMVSVDEIEDRDLAREVANRHLSDMGTPAAFKFARIDLDSGTVRERGDVAIVVLDGEGSIRVGGDDFEVHEGSIITVPAGMAYSARRVIKGLVVTRHARLNRGSDGIAQIATR